MVNFGLALRSSSSSFKILTGSEKMEIGDFRRLMFKTGGIVFWREGILCDLVGSGLKCFFKILLRFNLILYLGRGNWIFKEFFVGGEHVGAFFERMGEKFR